jgi:hypothetical protein
MRSGTNVMLACSGGAVLMDATGTVLVLQAYANGVDDIVGHDGTGYALISGGWLYRTDLALVPFDSVEYGPVGANPVLRYDLSNLWVIGDDTARFFDPSLMPTMTFGMGAPEGYTLLDAMPGSDVIMTAGVFASGPVEGAAGRSVDKFGAPSNTEIDALLHTVTATDLVFTPLTGAPPGHYIVSGSLVAFLENAGDVPISSARLLYFSPLSEPCCRSACA